MSNLYDGTSNDLFFAAQKIDDLAFQVLEKSLPRELEQIISRRLAYVLHTYSGTQHAFFNDTGAARYNEAAAKLAWTRTLEFYKDTLGGPVRS